MGKINVGFYADNASLHRDDQNRLVVLAQGIDEDLYAGAPKLYTDEVERQKQAAEREAKIRAEAAKIVDEQEAANKE